MRLTRAPSFLLAASLLFVWGCGGKRAHLPYPQPEQQEQVAKQKEVFKKKSGYLKDKMPGWELRLSKLSDRVKDKRGQGYDTTEAEAALALMEKSIGEAYAFIYNIDRLEQLKELEEKINELSLQEKKIKDLIKKAKPFGDQPLKKEQIQRKYNDERDRVVELRGEPLTKQPIGMVSLSLLISDPTDILRESRCFDGDRTVVLNTPPRGEIWIYPDRTVYVFIETNSIVESFFLRNDLESQDRDRLLVQLCPAQVYSGEFRLIYKSEVGQPAVDWASIMEQIFTGRWRMADMFGSGAQKRLAEATAALPDLALVSLAFNTKLGSLNKWQAKQFDIFWKLMQEIDPRLSSFPERAGKPSKETGPSRQNSQGNKKEDQRAEKQLEDRFKAVEKIFNWQKTLQPRDKDLDDLVKYFPGHEKKIRLILEALSEGLRKMNDELQNIYNDLSRFRNFREQSSKELIFKEDEEIGVWFVLQGVRFKEEVLPNGASTEKADISVKVKIEFGLGKKEPPLLIQETEIKIASVNKYIYKVKEDQRLASFGLEFPAKLSPGNYFITFVITDNLRVKTIEQKIQWIVTPDDSQEDDHKN